MVLRNVLSAQCYVEFVEKGNLYHRECLQDTGMTLLGLLIMFVSAFLKVPQIMKIVKSRSGEGINLKSVFVELFAVTAGASYSYINGYPFRAWGETFLMAIQQFVFIVFILNYESSFQHLVTFAAGYGALVGVIAAKYVPVTLLWYINAFNIPLMVFGKGIQISTNYRNKSTGQLSALTCALLVSVCIARLFTSLLMTRDSLMISAFGIATVTNSIVLFQVVHYWKSPADKKKNK